MGLAGKEHIVLQGYYTPDQGSETWCGTEEATDFYVYHRGITSGWCDPIIGEDMDFKDYNKAMDYAKLLSTKYGNIEIFID